MKAAYIPRAEPDMAFTKMISNEENKTGHTLQINSLMVLSALRSRRRLSLHELTELLHVSESRTKVTVQQLIERGLVETSENGESRAYILSPRVYREQDNSVGYVRQTGIDSLKFEELIIKLANQQCGYVTGDNVKELLNLNDNQAYRVLR